MAETEEYKRLREALQKPATPEAMREAAAAFAQYEKVSLGSNSRPTIVTLAAKGFPRAVPVDKIPEELARNPQFYEFMKKIVTRE